MPTDASTKPEPCPALAERDRRGHLAHPEIAEWSGAADQLATEAWSDLDWEEQGRAAR
jgi:hypothetical protein